MSLRPKRTNASGARAPTVRVKRIAGSECGRSFSETFSIGRDESCGLRVDSGHCSRKHAELAFTDGGWRVRDLGSTNGTFVDDERVEDVAIRGNHTLRLGTDGPVLEIAVETEPGAVQMTTARTLQSLPVPQRSSDASMGGGSGDPSLDGYIAKYFGAGDTAVGEHTQMIRHAYQTVHKRNQSKYAIVIGAVATIAALSVVYAAVQHWRVGRLEERAAAAYDTMKQLDVQAAKLQIYIEERADATLAEQLTELTRVRRQSRLQYEGYVEELGLRRGLTEEEREIYRVARIFNESEFEMPAMFVRAVRETIRDYWLSPAGRGRFSNAVALAESEGYTANIVQTMMHYGLPPEFYYLALQESNFDVRVSGPRTRWGIAKGTWQFIPETAQAYGLVVGPREQQRVFDPQDDRHSAAASTDAAARYLLEIYGQLAQASGLLAMASYNWGERRVVGRLQELLSGIPDEPESRSYWRFLTEYSHRMPDETKDYVLKIVAAAAIGQNPRLFGFDFDNPLQKHIEAAAHGNVEPSH